MTQALLNDRSVGEARLPTETRRLVKKLMVALASCLLIPAVSYLGDAGHVFHAQAYADRIANYMQQGYNVAGAENFDERLLQSRIIRDLPSQPSTLIIGSSRAMILSSELLRRPVINNAMSGASIDDLLAVQELYRRRGMHPRHVLLALDPWMLNAQYDDVRWKSLSAEAEAMRAELSLPRESAGLAGRVRSTLGAIRVRLHDQLLSPDYFRRSLFALVTGDRLHPTPHAHNEDMTRLRDGSIAYGVAFEDRTEAAVLEDARLYVAMDPLYGFRNFSSVTSQQRNALVKLLTYMRASGADVRIVLMPYHPVVYHYLSTNNRYVSILEVERAARSVAATAAVPISGSYDPSAVGLTGRDFVDGMHPKAQPSAAIALSALQGSR